MRYPPEHREKTRQRILSQAARLFRRRGYGGVGIDGIMAAARLTRGGFYGYFRSKADLFAAVMRREPDLHRRMRERTSEDPAGLIREALEIVAGYLHPDNQNKVGVSDFTTNVLFHVAVVLNDIELQVDNTSGSVAYVVNVSIKYTFQGGGPNA